jgi:hypothetical protein
LGNKIRVRLAGGLAARRSHELVLQWFVCSRLPLGRGKKESGGRTEVAGRVSGEPDGVRAGEAMLLQSAEEGAQVDILEWVEPRQEVLSVL